MEQQRQNRVRKQRSAPFMLVTAALLLLTRAEQPVGGAALAETAPAAETAAPADTLAAALTECGQASYYADSLAGGATASGEPYSPSAFTAAHKTLPLGTKIIVENSSSGARVAVTVNDRGPFTPGRIVDLSRAAAESIGMIDAGVIEACIGEAPAD